MLQFVRLVIRTAGRDAPSWCHWSCWEHCHHQPDARWAHLSHMNGRLPICHSDYFIMVRRRVNTQEIMSAILWTFFWCRIILVVRRLSENQIWDLLLKHLVISKIVPEMLISKPELLKPANNLTTNFATTHLTNFSSFLLDFPVGYFKIHSPSIL